MGAANFHSGFPGPTELHNHSQRQRIRHCDCGQVPTEVCSPCTFGRQKLCVFSANEIMVLVLKLTIAHLFELEIALNDSQANHSEDKKNHVAHINV